MAHGKYTVMIASEKGGKFEKKELEFKKALGDDEVEIDIISSGLCRSDYHMWKNDWGMTEYPFVGGHEGFGKVSKVGKNVKTHKEGDHVGLGWQAGYCLNCNLCLRGDHNLCSKNQGTIIGRHGTFATKVRAQAAAVVQIPKGFEGDHVGPLFCGGVTVFNPIQEYAKPGQRVGVVGIGGLGSMAVQQLNKFGCRVTAFTTSEKKRDSARELGAHEVIISTDEEQMKAAEGQFDLILSTVGADLKWEQYVACLAPRGRLHLVGIPSEPLSIPAFPLCLGHRSIGGSPCGAPSTIRNLLEFAQFHAIKPKIDRVFKFDEINEAMKELDTNPQGRVVLTWSV